MTAVPFYNQFKYKCVNKSMQTVLLYFYWIKNLQAQAEDDFDTARDK